MSDLPENWIVEWADWDERGRARFTMGFRQHNHAAWALVNAAPELLEALRQGVILEQSDMVDVEWKEALSEWLKTARAAIAKAEGRRRE